MKRNILIGAIAVFALLTFVASVGKHGKKTPPQDTAPRWKLVFKVPKTNTNAPLPDTNSLLKPN